jgi:hypothetical protein
MHLCPHPRAQGQSRILATLLLMDVKHSLAQLEKPRLRTDPAHRSPMRSSCEVLAPAHASLRQLSARSLSSSKPTSGILPVPSASCLNLPRSEPRIVNCPARLPADRSEFGKTFRLLRSGSSGKKAQSRPSRNSMPANYSCGRHPGCDVPMLLETGWKCNPAFVPRGQTTGHSPSPRNGLQLPNGHHWPRETASIEARAGGRHPVTSVSSQSGR